MNITTQCCGIALMLVILYFYQRQRKIHLNTEKAFMKLFCSIAISLFFDILSLVSLVNMSKLPVLTVDLICKTYLATLILVAWSGIHYVCTDIFNGDARQHTTAILYRCVAVAALLLIYILPIEKTYNNALEIYTSGPSALATYGFSFLYFAVIMILIFRYRDRMNPLRREAVEIWVAIWILAAVIQFFFKHLLIVGYAGTISIMIIYLKLENPETNLNRKTGLYNLNGFLQYTQQLYKNNQPFSILNMVFLHPQIRNMSVKKEEEIRTEVYRFLQDLPDAPAFYLSDDEILLVFRDPQWAEECEAKLKRRFQLGWGSNGNVFITPRFLMFPDARIVNRIEDILHLLRYVRLNNVDFSENETVRIDQSSLDAMYHEIETEELILDAIENERFEVYYQPIYSTADRTFTAAEALVRIRDSENQIVLPGAFIETAEKNGMIIQLGEIVFEKVCQFIQKHNPRQYGLKYIEVNLSVVQCTYEHLAESFIRIMEKYHIDPSWINFEITESASVSSRKTLLENINQLTSYGIQFSLDDFGTGHSNLNYIVDMPIHIVKFDRDMTVSYFENQKARYVMDAAMLMIKRMNLKIVSEGIETEEQYKVMHSLGIHYIQGFYFSKPLSSAAFLDFLKTKN